MALKKSEKQLAKERVPAWHAEVQRKAQQEVKELLKHIKSEPFPNDLAVDREHQKMVGIERRLARLLQPLKTIANTPKKILRKKTAKSSKKKKSVKKKATSRKRTVRKSPSKKKSSKKRVSRKKSVKKSKRKIIKNKKKK